MTVDAGTERMAGECRNYLCVTMMKLGDVCGYDAELQASAQNTASDNDGDKCVDVPVHPFDKIYTRKPWKQTLDDLCSWREGRIARGDDRWPRTMVPDKHEKMLGKWLANQRSYRKIMDANPQNKKGLKGMCPERVRLLDERLPGWMGEPSKYAPVRVAGVQASETADDAAEHAFVAAEEMKAGAATSKPVWTLRATWVESLERARVWRLNNPDRWPIQQTSEGDVEEGRIYRWLIEQRRYKRNYESGKSLKLGGMTQERLDMLADVLGDDWYLGNRSELNGVSRSTARSLAKQLKSGNKRARLERGGQGELNHGLNYMASLASHEMKSMEQAAAIAQGPRHAVYSNQGHTNGYYPDAHHAHVAHHFLGFSGQHRQYHNTQQHIQQLADSQGLQHMRAFAAQLPVTLSPVKYGNVSSGVQEEGEEDLQLPQLADGDELAHEADLYSREQ